MVQKAPGIINMGQMLSGLQEAQEWGSGGRVCHEWAMRAPFPYLLYPSPARATTGVWCPVFWMIPTGGLGFYSLDAVVVVVSQIVRTQLSTDLHLVVGSVVAELDRPALEVFKSHLQLSYYNIPVKVGGIEAEQSKPVLLNLQWWVVVWVPQEVTLEHCGRHRWRGKLSN